MARRSSDTLDDTAAAIGTALGHLAAKVAAFTQQRTQIANELRDLLKRGQSMLADLGGDVSAGVETGRKGKGGRPKGYKMSDETRKKLREAWKRRKAAAARNQ